MGKGLSKPLIACFSAIILLMIVIIVVSIKGFSEVYTNSSIIVSDVLPLRKASSQININLLTLETSLRGYMISRDENFISTCETAKTELDSNLGILTKLTTDELKNLGIDRMTDEQLRKSGFTTKYETELTMRQYTKDLIPQVYSIINYYENSISLIDTGYQLNAYSDIRTGKSLMDSIKATLDSLNAEIDKFSNEKILKSSSTKSSATNILIAVSIIVFLLILVIITMVIEVITENMNHKVKENESLEKTIRDQEEFYANISHELKTPLNVILSTIQLLDLYNRTQTTLDTESMDKYFRIMKQNCFRLSRLSNNLIDISKIEAGYVELHLKNLDIVSIIEDITMSVVEYGEAKGISLIFDTDFEEKLIAVDPDKIERIMLNLLSNAFKFTSPGDEILVTLHDLENKIQVSVKDTGIGIPEDKLEVIFDRFKQVDKSLTRNTEGSGIGLSLTKSLISMHGGSITVSSKLGHGSEFIFELPVKLIAPEESDSVIIKKDEEHNNEKITIEFSDIYFD